MFGNVNDEVEAWIKSIATDIDVVFQPPSDTSPGEPKQVHAYLMEIAEIPAMRGSVRPPLQLELKYLITTTGQSTNAANDLLGTLAFAAMQHEDFRTEFRQIDGATWRAFGATPRPSFLLRAIQRVDFPESVAPLVTEVVTHKGAMLSLTGSVVGPGDLPISAANVELPLLSLRAVTDRKGQFFFPAVPAEPRHRQIRIRAKGKELELRSELGTAEAEPLVIRLQLEV